MTISHIRFIALTGAALAGLSACGAQPKDLYNAYYWQRSNVSEGAYMEGPKAQQMLNRDISRCVVEIRELERLDAIRYVTPAEIEENGELMDWDAPEQNMADWESPERDGYLRAEHLEYHDFETCMIAKGWERVEYLPYDVADEARGNYVETIDGQGYRSIKGER